MPKRKLQVNKQAGDAGGASEVQTIYADLVTFVMMLFILLFVLSYNDEKSQDFITELQIKFGEEVEDKQQTLTTDALLVSKINHYIKKEDLSEYAHVVVDEYRVKMILNPPILFDSGKVAIKQAGKKVLAGVGDIFDNVVNPLEIEGHTDNVPINTEIYPTNWELSSARAASVAAFFQRNGIRGDRITCIGKGEFNPIKTNKTTWGREKNRRIVIEFKIPDIFKKPKDLDSELNLQKSTYEPKFEK